MHQLTVSLPWSSHNSDPPPAHKLRTPESNVQSFLLLINPENSEPPKVASLIVFQLQSTVKFLMYNTNIFVHLQIYPHDTALYNKGNMWHT